MLSLCIVGLLFYVLCCQFTLSTSLTYLFVCYMHITSELSVHDLFSASMSSPVLFKHLSSWILSTRTKSSRTITISLKHLICSRCVDPQFLYFSALLVYLILPHCKLYILVSIVWFFANLMHLMPDYRLEQVNKNLLWSVISHLICFLNCFPSDPCVFMYLIFVLLLLVQLSLSFSFDCYREWHIFQIHVHIAMMLCAITRFLCDFVNSIYASFLRCWCWDSLSHCRVMGL